MGGFSIGIRCLPRCFHFSNFGCLNSFDRSHTCVDRRGEGTYDVEFERVKREDAAETRLEDAREPVAEAIEAAAAAEGLTTETAEENETEKPVEPQTSESETSAEIEADDNATEDKPAETTEPETSESESSEKDEQKKEQD